MRWGSRGLQLLVLLAALAYPVFTRPSQQQLAAVVAIYAIVAVSLVVLTGWSGHISLGHFALVGFGAAATGSLIAVHHVDLMYAVPAGELVGALVAFLIGLPALQIRGPYLAVSTLAFAVSSAYYFLDHKYLKWLAPVVAVPRPELWERISIASDKQMYYLCLFCLILVLAFARGLRKSRTGRAIIAVRDNPLAAQSSGMSAVRLQLLAFAISGAIAGFAGSLFVLPRGLPHRRLQPGREPRVVLDGRHRRTGLGAGGSSRRRLHQGLEYILAPGYAFLASGLGIVVLLMILPEGLGGALYWLRDEALRRIATRRSLVVPSLTADVRIEEEEARVTLDTALGGLVESRSPFVMATEAPRTSWTHPVAAVRDFSTRVGPIGLLPVTALAGLAAPPSGSARWPSVSWPPTSATSSTSTTHSSSPSPPSPAFCHCWRRCRSVTGPTARTASSSPGWPV